MATSHSTGFCSACLARISGARFVALEGRNHLILEHDPAWPRFRHEVERFLAGDG